MDYDYEMRITTALFFLLFISKLTLAQSIDVLNYNITIEPDIATKAVKGSVSIRFKPLVKNLTSVEFDCGALEVDSVTHDGVKRDFVVKDRKLKISLVPANSPKIVELEIRYHGVPKYGVRFFPENSQVYTVFSTSQWTVVIDAPDDKASVTTTLVIPDNLNGISTGELAASKPVSDNRKSVTFVQKSSIPTYIFGFAIGPYRVVKERKNGIDFHYFVTKFTDEETKRIFRHSADMLRFYEKISGVKYADKTYTQVLAAGDVAQEMSSFTAINEAYGKRVLVNEQELWLGAHEFAHQWWGNMVTCRDWNHFWLNEGIANFVTAAYIEHQFGPEVYQREIDRYRTSYEKVRDAGKDRSLVFPDWNRPTREDRTLVYDKGAYVMHLLRQEMGEVAFWKGFKNFTSRNFGKSVVTADFESTMQEVTAKDLKPFFAKWVHLK